MVREKIIIEREKNLLTIFFIFLLSNFKMTFSLMPPRDTCERYFQKSDVFRNFLLPLYEKLLWKELVKDYMCV